MILVDVIKFRSSSSSKKKKKNGKIDYHREERGKTRNKVGRCLKVSEKNTARASVVLSSVS